jgi:hypothetical protein
MAGTVGAIFNCGLQLGSAIGLAAVCSIQASVQDRNGGPSNYEGQSAGFWFMLVCICIAAMAILVFYRTDTARNRVKEAVVGGGSDANLSDITEGGNCPEEKV